MNVLTPALAVVSSVLPFRSCDRLHARIRAHDDRLGAFRVDDADRDERRAAGGEVDHRGAGAIGEVAVAVGDEAMRRARAVAGADVEVDAGFGEIALVLAEREGGVRAVIHPVQAQADIVLRARHSAQCHKRQDCRPGNETCFDRHAASPSLLAAGPQPATLRPNPTARSDRQAGRAERLVGLVVQDEFLVPERLRAGRRAARRPPRPSPGCARRPSRSSRRRRRWCRH